MQIRQTVMLSTGALTLRAWGAGTADGRLMDLLTLTATLGELRREALAYEAGDVEPGVWAAFWRLAHASLEPGQALSAPLTWGDVLTVLDALWTLNDVEDAEGKLVGLTQRVQSMAARLRQAHLTAPSTSS